ncbi:uncharacterized protein N7525_000762 [Penicillium rubens]|uniref:uncharacterized protein n=1 Tax=Penicillium rubens TaxID=1108849 RepID=UPI002A59A53B|nr:uncharacterized protein N7525_000762 [Penicillium rubens]KAJ5843021.1 hypothetical protein N7525_000762 [Penicillium rubens]KAJ5846398.1 hypothetical protein N7534_010067 [Penicillium rubens]
MADGSFVAATNEEGDWESLLKIGFRTLAYIMLQFWVLCSASSARFLTGIGVSGLVDVISSLLNGEYHFRFSIFPKGDADNLADLVSPSEVAVLRSYLSVASTLGISSGDPIGP